MAIAAGGIGLLQLWPGVSWSAETAADAPGKVYPDPARPLPGFKPHELPFRTPADGVARAEFRSEPFYAVILESAPPCHVPEAERLRVQALFPDRKVFSVRFQCDDNVEENIRYTNVNPKAGFLAVYAGTTRSQAQTLLKQVKALGKFPGANLRRMQAVIVYP